MCYNRSGLETDCESILATLRLCLGTVRSLEAEACALSSLGFVQGGSEPKTLDHSAEYMEPASALRSTAQELGGKQLSFVADACLCYVHVMQQKWGFPVFF